MRKLTNDYGFPEAVVRAIQDDDYDRGDSDYTATELLKPPRILALQRKYKDKIVEDVSDLIYAFEGKILHKVLEEANREALVEKRFYAKVAGKKISAQIDTLCYEHGRLSDWKRCPAFKLTSKEPDWAFQLNTQAFLLIENGLEVNELEIVAFAKDHSKVQAATVKSYPKSAIKRIPIELWDKEKTKAMIEERIEIHEKAKKSLPKCSDDERFKRFNRSFGAIVPLRCMFYCSVSPWCEQYKAELKKENANEVSVNPKSK